MATTTAKTAKMPRATRPSDTWCPRTQSPQHAYVPATMDPRFEVCSLCGHGHRRQTTPTDPEKEGKEGAMRP